jgi:hypothetical protein
MKKLIRMLPVVLLLALIIMVPRSVSFAAGTSMALSWNSLGPGFEYSLDINTKDGQHIGPCIGASVLQSNTSVTYTGSCSNAAKTKVPLSNIETFVLVYTNSGDWKNDAHNTKIKNDASKSVLQFVLKVPVGAAALSWNSLGTDYEYSLDINTKDGQHIGPCIGANVIGSATNVTYAGTCLNAAKTKVPLSNIETFVLVYTNSGDWKNDAHSTKIKNDSSGSTLKFNLSIPCELDGMVIADGSTETLYTETLATDAFSCAAASVPVSCARGELTKPAGTLSASCSEVATVPFPVQPGGAPAILELKDGSLLSAYNRHVSKLTTIDVYRSQDKGETWSYLSTILSVPTTAGAQFSVANAFLRQLSDGRIIAAYRYHDGPVVADATAFATFRLQSKVSTDGGLTWGKAVTIEQINNAQSSSVGIWEPYVIEKSDKTLQVYYAKERPSPCMGSTNVSQDIVMRESTNGGASWGSAVTALHRSASREGVPAVAQAKDGTMFITFETWRNESCTSADAHIVPGLAMSTDGGYVWQYLPDIYSGEPTKVNSGWPDMVRLQDGRLLMRFTLGSGGSTPEVALMVTSNVPGKDAKPVWRMLANSGISKTSIGKMVQLSSGDVLSTNTASGTIPVSVSTIPLQALKAPVVASLPSAHASLLASVYMALQQLAQLLPFLK